ncbi:AraC family transcriptional regulator [Paenibacillus sp. FSL H8-0457]|uniref:AraC family transcriptional regulator n=1 Tax=Bacillales TaxID=1385 RepID=UPI0001788A2C|nr:MULTISPECIES: AraC family transcriptional regulator [Paenibacillus]ACX63057.1 transcriptional regulator, AraC family [Paenibacillus sp. Y412MC10]ETT60493.1 AraC family transcriptional regulator [Paenibacillus sp. FSL H8-457]MCM3261677.1 AraC family transcriptional regulator [Paenibacillus lautus]QOT08719.1 AraC family transcriptional regulator [Paenibacillus sp. JNUCC-32]
MQEYEYEYAEFIYYTPGYLDKEAQIWPVRAGRSLAKPNYRVGPKRIECYSLHFVHEGTVRLEFDGKRVDLQKNDLFCLFPGRTYYYHLLPSDAPLRMSWLALDGSRVRPLLELAGLVPESPFGRQMISSRVEKSAECVIDALAGVERWKPSVSLELHGLVYGLLAGMVPDAASAEPTELAGWINECLDYMELHATEGISVQQVAEFAGVHRSYFSNMFTSQVGMPPLKYLQRIRMDKAKRLLTETDATITEIALSLGYPNLYSFTRAFKIYFKVPPITMRENPC